MAKSDGWKEFTSNIKYPSEVSKLIKSFNNSKKNALGLLKNKEGVYCNALYSNYRHLPTILHVWLHNKYEFAHYKHGFK